MNPVKLGIAIIAIIIAFKLLTALTTIVLGLIIPVGIVAGICLILYGVFSGKALGSGGRGRLP